MTDTLDWHARRTFDGIMHGDDAIIIYRRRRDATEALQGVTAGRPDIQEHPDNMVTDGPVYLRFPQGVLEAIAEEIKPGPSQGEVRRLEEALTIERARVDKALDGAAALPYAEDVSPLDGEAVQSIVLRLADTSVHLEREMDRAADLYLGLDLALRLAQEAYERATQDGVDVSNDLPDLLRRLLAHLSGTIERDARVYAPAPPVTPEPVTAWQPPAPPEPR